MSHTQHERVDRIVQVTDRHGTFDRLIIGLYNPDGRDKVRENAERSANEEGVTYVAIVTQITRWRGKNGKRTTQETAREVIKESPDCICASCGHAYVGDGDSDNGYDCPKCGFNDTGEE